MDDPAETVVVQVVIQVAGYAGAAAGIIGTLALLALSGDVSPTVVLLVACAMTLVLLGAGIVVVDAAVHAYRRLGSVLCLLAVVSWAVAVQTLLFGVLELGADGGSEAETAAILSALLTTAGALCLWVRVRRSLQLIALFAAAVGTVVVVVVAAADPPVGPDQTFAAAVVWLFAVVWAAAGERAIAPRRTALVLGTVTAAAAPFVAISDAQGVGTSSALGAEVWAFATGVGILAYGAMRADRAVEGIGVAAVVLAAGGIVGDHLVDSRGAAMVSLLLGVALLGASLLGIRRRRPVVPPPSSGPLPPAP